MQYLKIKILWCSPISEFLQGDESVLTGLTGVGKKCGHKILREVPWLHNTGKNSDDEQSENKKKTQK